MGIWWKLEIINIYIALLLKVSILCNLLIIQVYNLNKISKWNTQEKFQNDNFGSMRERKVVNKQAHVLYDRSRSTRNIL